MKDCGPSAESVSGSRAAIGQDGQYRLWSISTTSNSHFGRDAERLASFRSCSHPIQQLHFVLPIPTIRKLRAAIIMRIADAGSLFMHAIRFSNPLNQRGGQGLVLGIEVNGSSHRPPPCRETPNNLNWTVVSRRRFFFVASDWSHVTGTMM